MTADPKLHRAHLYLVEVIIAVVLLGVAGFFLVRGMQRAREAQFREREQKMIAHMHQGDVQTVLNFAKAHPELGNARDGGGRTPLHWAAQSNAKDIVELLLSRGADVNSKDKANRTPLHYAAELNAKDVVKLLLARGASIDVRDVGDSTPLQWAVARNNQEIIDMLRAHGAKD